MTLRHEALSTSWLKLDDCLWLDPPCFNSVSIYSHEPSLLCVSCRISFTVVSYLHVSFS